MSASPFAVLPLPPRVVGAGLVALDVVVDADGVKPSRARAGGTCGNVLCALSYLGWLASPIARLKNDRAARYVLEDLARWSVKLDFVSTDIEGSTPVFVQTTRRRQGQDPVHSFAARCPVCGARLPGYKAATAVAVEGFLPSVKAADVFFFDRASRGTLVLARHCAELGALVMFEPSGIGDPHLFREAVEVSHVLKYSHERLGSEASLEDCQIPLQIETLGREGLRYRSRTASSMTGSWKRMSAFAADSIQDTSGCGDWCSAGLLHLLGPGGSARFLGTGAEELAEALRFGQALSAWNCGFEGARGGMYEVTRKAFAAQVKAILAQGRAKGATAGRPPEAMSELAGEFCALCVARLGGPRRLGPPPDSVTLL